MRRVNPPSISASELAVLEQAAEWFALLRWESATDADRAAWRAWHEQAPAHQEAWRRVERMSGKLAALPGPAAREALHSAGGRRDTVKLLVLLCAGAGASGALLGSRAPRDYVASLGARHRTATGEVAALALSDGTSAWLNTASAADVEYDGVLRRIVLRRGEILLHSAPDIMAPPRPLVVDSPHGRLRALGTRFAVRIVDGATRLAVYDGAVRIETADGVRQAVVPAGLRTSFGETWIGDSVAAHESGAAWRSRRLVANQMRVDDFLAELGRYRHGYLGCDPAVAGLRLVGTYALDNTDAALAALERVLPVRVRRPLPFWAMVGAT